MSYDIIIVGGGPAGLTAAVHTRARNRSVLVVSNELTASPLCKAQEIENYPGLSKISGLELVQRLAAQAKSMGAEFRPGRVMNVMPVGDHCLVSVGSHVVEGKSVILATGVSRAAPIPGEERLLGRGVSYCATCDGMFYRGKDIVVAGNSHDLEDEAEYLSSIGCLVHQTELHGLTILGEYEVEGVLTRSGERISCDGVFLLRSSMAPAKLVAGIELKGRHILVDRFMATNLPGIFAAGDCTGEPLQIAKAVGEGQMAAHSALAYLNSKA